MADFYWVGGTGNWSEFGTHWATASGGGVFHANAPTSSDDVYFDANSFDGASQVVTIDATSNCKDMDWTGATNSPTLAFSTNRIQAYGSITFISAMSLTTGVSSYCLYVQSDCNLTTAGKTIPSGILSAQADSNLQLQDDLVSDSRLVLQRGVFNTNNHNASFGLEVVISTDNTKTITLGNSTITTSTSFQITATANLTFNANTSVINVGKDFTGGSCIYNNVNLTGATSTITGSNTFATLGLTRADVQTITFTDGTTQTLTNLTRDSGVSVKTLAGSGAAGYNLVKRGGTSNVIDLRNMSISYSTVSPSQTWYAGIMSTDGGNNTGWNFANAPHRNMWLLRRRK